jgi:hypothetical protein
MNNAGAPAPTEFRGVRVLKWLFAGAGVLLIVSAITGVSSGHVSPGHTVITHHTLASRLLTAALAPFYFAFFYGLHRRAFRAWQAGFALLIASFLLCVFRVWWTSADLPGTPRGLLTAFAFVAGAGVFMYWWRWWLRQRGYFIHATPVA